MIWQLNRQRITPLFDKASRLLDAGECRRLYFHRFMVGGGLGSVAANEYAQLRMAYDDFLPLLESDFRYIGRLEAVFLFGHDDRGSLEGSFTEGPEQYALGLRVLERCGNGFAFPDMLGQRESMFRAFANKSEVVRRILATLRHIEYAPAFRGTSLRFWAFVLVVFMSGGQERRQLLDDLSAMSRSHPLTSRPPDRATFSRISPKRPNDHRQRPYTSSVISPSHVRTVRLERRSGPTAIACLPLVALLGVRLIGRLTAT